MGSKMREVVFSTRSAYGCMMVGVLVFGIVVVLLTIIPISLDPNTSNEDKKAAVWTLIWSAVAVLILYIFILPTKFEVRSDASIGVATLFITYSFVDAVRAYAAGGMFEGALRPRIKFATALDKRVVVQRKNGLWDLLLSPSDVDGFVKAVNDASQHLELGDTEQKEFVQDGEIS